MALSTDRGPMTTAVKPARAAVIGGGVIGGGWVARLIQNGIDVGIFDPDPDAAPEIALCRNV